VRVSPLATADGEGWWDARDRRRDLAARLDRRTLPFKADVRKLKKLGLTESLDIGYRLSPTWPGAAGEIGRQP
jgi:hypothetical protein